MSFWIVEELYIFKSLIWACLCTLLTLTVFALPNLTHTFVKWQRNVVKSIGLHIRPGLKPLGPPLSSSVTLGKSCNRFNTPFSFRLSIESNFHIYLIGLLGLSNEVRLLKKQYSSAISHQNHFYKCRMDSFGQRSSVITWSLHLTVLNASDRSGLAFGLYVSYFNAFLQANLWKHSSPWVSSYLLTTYY